jgi:hypothetical protein
MIGLQRTLSSESAGLSLPQRLINPQTLRIPRFPDSNCGSRWHEIGMASLVKIWSSNSIEFSRCSLDCSLPVVLRDNVIVRQDNSRDGSSV